MTVKVLVFLGALAVLVAAAWELIVLLRFRPPTGPYDDLPPQYRALADMSDVPTAVLHDLLTPKLVEKSRWPAVLATLGAVLVFASTVVDLFN